MISNPDFKGQFDYAPYREFEVASAASQTSCLATGCGISSLLTPLPSNSTCKLTSPLGYNSEDPDTHGLMLVLLLLVVTGHWLQMPPVKRVSPLYFSPGNVKNSVRHAHHDAPVPIGFLAIPKSISSIVRSLCFLTSFQAHGRWTSQLFHLVPVPTNARVTQVILSSSNYS